MAMPDQTEIDFQVAASVKHRLRGLVAVNPLWLANDGLEIEAGDRGRHAQLRVRPDGVLLEGQAAVHSQRQLAHALPRDPAAGSASSAMTDRGIACSTSPSGTITGPAGTSSRSRCSSIPAISCTSSATGTTPPPTRRRSTACCRPRAICSGGRPTRCARACCRSRTRGLESPGGVGRRRVARRRRLHRHEHDQDRRLPCRPARTS